ncbi:fatty acid-binding protein, liver [Aplysia californica]|uniref:Fatty acid-binding protein, liver n=1 Tax=Aplysia californica TaxID=6500 RepID=A0ABM0JE96_APLCA|nr:fatty acid-binding protein, liver [Aplysia californica]
MVEQLFAKWKLEKNENFDEYMQANKVNIALRKVGNTITNHEEISRDGDEWTLNITSTFKNSKLVFKLGEPFEMQTLDGRTMKTTFTVEGNKLIGLEEPINEGDTPNKYEREVTDDGKMVLTCTAIEQNIVAKRYFTKESS